MRFRLAVLLSIPMALAALEAQADVVDCGGNSFSYGEIVPNHGGPQKGPIEILPDTLCADLIEHRPRKIESLNLTIEGWEGPKGRPVRPRPDRPD